MLNQSKFRILIVDDESDILDALSHLLAKVDGIEVFTAQNAEDAIRFLPQVDAIIADCIFPEVAAFERHLKRLGKPNVRMSGKITRAENFELAKPFTAKQVRDSVELLRFFHTGVCQKA